MKAEMNRREQLLKLSTAKLRFIQHYSLNKFERMFAYAIIRQRQMKRS